MDHSTELISGVIEGFYGRPWSQEQRQELFSRLADWKLNTYIYGPKDDLKLRAEWRSTYSEAEAAELKLLIDGCAAAGIRFNYAIAPGLDMSYSDENDWKALEQRAEQLIKLGVRDFTLLFDDIPAILNEQDAERFETAAGAHCSVTNRFLDFLNSRVTEPRLYFCPTEYCDRLAVPTVAESAYLLEVGEKLDPAVEVFWTGPEIVSETLPVQKIREVARVLQRKPLIWDNFHANDYDIRRLYLGPYAGREADLLAEVSGIISNPNCEYEANFVPLFTLARFMAQPESYDSSSAYLTALDAWQSRFTLHAGGTLERHEIELLGDLLYLPFEPGRQAREILHLGQELLLAASEQRPEDLLRLRELSEAVTSLFQRLTHLENRELLYTLYEYVWEIQEETKLLVDYLDWLETKPGPDSKFAAPDRLVNTYRGGFTAEIQRLLPMHNGQLTALTERSRFEQ